MLRMTQSCPSQTSQRVLVGRWLGHPIATFGESLNLGYEMTGTGCANFTFLSFWGILGQSVFADYCWHAA